MASSKTKRDYLIKGLHYAAQGQRNHPDVTPLEALCRHAEDRQNIIMPSTMRIYRQQYGAAAAKLCRDAKLGRPELRVAVVRFVNALNAITGTPPKPRTASKKVKDPRDWMVKEVFGHLKLVAVRHHRIRSAACALFCLLVPKLGTRPVELTSAWVAGNTLFVPSAKQPDGDPSVRTIDISGFHPTEREALLALIYIVDRDVEAGGYDAWLSRLAETLARACASVARKTGQVISRLSPSSFRHTAISTWHTAGYTAEEIAELVGHRDLRSQNAYKRTSSAWPVTAGLAKPVQQDAPPGPEQVRTNQSDPVLDLDDMPQPEAHPVPVIDSALWPAARQKLESALGEIKPITGDPPNEKTSRPPASTTRPKR